jgi:molecular chaperone DnaK (HSP70)
MNPYNTVFDAKRLIGRKFDDAEVQADMKHWPFKVINKGGKPVIQVEFKGEQKEFVSVTQGFFFPGRILAHTKETVVSLTTYLS